MGKPSIVVQTECSECGVRVHWKVDDISPSREEWQPLDAESFACERWRDHHEAGHRARLNSSGRARSGPVAGRVLTKLAPCPTTAPATRLPRERPLGFPSMFPRIVPGYRGLLGPPACEFSSQGSIVNAG